MLKNRFFETIVIVLGVISLVVGAVFIGVGVQKGNYITDNLKAQQVTLGLSKDQIAAGQYVDNAARAQVAAETLAAHLKSISPTFSALTAKNSSGKFDPTNATNLDYGQGLNMENSLNMVVMGYGVVQETEILGITLVVIGLAITLVGVVLFRKNTSVKA
jgi:hypothetical protein